MGLSIATLDDLCAGLSAPDGPAAALVAAGGVDLRDGWARVTLRASAPDGAEDLVTHARLDRMGRVELDDDGDGLLFWSNVCRDSEDPVEVTDGDDLKLLAAAVAAYGGGLDDSLTLSVRSFVASDYDLVELILRYVQARAALHQALCAVAR